MNHIKSAVKPILTDMGFFNGKDVSAKEVFDLYLKRFPKGVGPLGVFMRLVQNESSFRIKKIINDTKTDFIFSFLNDPEIDLLEYDPRIIKP